MCTDLVQRYDQVEGLTRSCELNLPQLQWGDDVMRIQELIRYGSEYGEGIINHMILPNVDVSAILKPNLDTLSETGRLAVGLFDESRETLQGVTWAKVADTQMRALTKIVRTLPDQQTARPTS